MYGVWVDDNEPVTFDTYKEAWDWAWALANEANGYKESMSVGRLDGQLLTPDEQAYSTW